jgi:hypothetical protein
MKRMLLPKRVAERNYGKGPIAYFHQRQDNKAKCEIFVV